MASYYFIITYKLKLLIKNISMAACCSFHNHKLKQRNPSNYRAFKLQTWDMGDGSLCSLPSAVASLDAHAEIQLVHAV